MARAVVWIMWLLATAALCGLYLGQFGSSGHAFRRVPIGWLLRRDAPLVSDSTAAEAAIGLLPDGIRPTLQPPAAAAPTPAQAQASAQSAEAQIQTQTQTQQTIQSQPPPPPTPPLPPPAPPPPPPSSGALPLPSPAVDPVGTPLLSHGATLRELKSTEAEVVGRPAIATLLPVFDEEAYRMLMSVQKFEAEKTVFVSCTQDVGHLLPKLFPHLRFVVMPLLKLSSQLKTTGAYSSSAVRKFGDWPDYDAEKSKLLKTTFDLGAPLVWYVESDIVLFDKLPVPDQTTPVAISHQRAADSKNTITSPGLMYFASVSALLRFEKDLKTSPGTSKVTDLGCSHSVGWYEMDPGYSIGGVDKFKEINCAASRITFNGCTLLSLQLRQRKQAMRVLPALLTALKQCEHPVEPVFETADETTRMAVRGSYFGPQQFGSRRFPMDPFFLPPGPCTGPWCRPGDGLRQVIHEKTLIDLTSDAANVKGQIVICILIPDLLSDEVHRFLRSVKARAASTTLFVSCTEDVARQLPILYPMVRFTFHPSLGKYQDPTSGLLHPKDELTRMGLWASFLLEGPSLLRIALDSGARAAWLMDVRTVLLAPLPTFEESVQVSLGISEAAGGSFDSGLAYFASQNKVDKWIQAVQAKGESAQADLDVFKGDPDVKALASGVGVGRTWAPEDLSLNFTCVRGKAPGEGTILWKSEPVLSLHYTVPGTETRKMPSIISALEECQHPTLPVIRWAPPTVMFDHHVVQSFNATANVIGHVVLCTSIMVVDDKVHRLLQSVLTFEANTTIFVSCTMAIADQLMVTYPSLRFSFHAQLDKYREQLHGAMPNRASMVQSGHWAAFSVEKAELMRIAFEAGVRAVWYVAPGTVLMAPLPTMQPSTEVAYGPKEPLQLKNGELASTVGVIYFRRVEVVKLWLDKTTTYLFENGAFQGSEGRLEHSVGIVSTSFDVASELLRSTFVGDRYLLGCGHAVDFNAEGGPSSCADPKCQDGSLEVGGCKLFSALCDAASASRISSCLGTALQTCSPRALPLLKAPVAVPQLGKPPALIRQDTMRTFNTDAEGVQQVTFWHKRFKVMDPGANIVGKIVMCILINSIGDEVKRLIRSIQVFEADITLFVSCTQVVADELPVKYPDLRLAIYPRLDKYRNHISWNWHGRKDMERMPGDVWPNFNLEKTILMRLALSSGARGVWYVDADVVLVGKLQEHPWEVKAGLSPHNILPERADQFGYFNSGVVYFSAIPMADKWIQSTFSSTKLLQTRDQHGLTIFRKDPDAFENYCGVDVGMYQIRDRHNKEQEEIYDLVRCENGEIMFKSCVVSSFHYHLGEDGPKLQTVIQRAIEDCNHPALEVFPKGHARYPAHPPNAVEPVRKNGRNIPLNSPDSGIPGNVVVVAVLTHLNTPLTRLLDSLTNTNVQKTVIAAISEGNAPKVTGMYKNLKFAFWRHMHEKFRHPDTWLWPTADEMIQTGQWTPFRQIKFDLMRTAFENGATGVWYLSEDVAVKGPLPVFPPEKKIALIRHSPVPAHQPKNGTGIFDEGVMYVADKATLHRMETLMKTPENYDSLDGSPELQELSCTEGTVPGRRHPMPVIKCGDDKFWLYPR